MTQQTVHNHVYEVVPANAVGASYVRHAGAGAWGPAGTIEFANGAVTFNGNGVDRLLCNDKIIGFDWYGNTGKAYRMYNAAFKRVPDTDGLAANVNAMDTGVTIAGLAAAFLASAEGLATYPANTPNSVFITQLYVNVLNRQPSSAEVNAWLAYMAAPYNYTKADVLVGFSESPENQTAINPSIEPGVLMTRSYFGV